MRKIFAIFFIFLFALYGCEPTSDNVTLKPINMLFYLNEDKKAIKTGDTLIIEASINSNVTGVQLKDGDINLPCDVGINPGNDSVITNFGNGRPAYRNFDYDVIILNGSIEYNSSVDSLQLNYLSSLNNDTFKVKYKYIFKHYGIYTFHFNDGFMFSSSGKSYTYGTFNVVDPHWDLWKIPNNPNPQPNEELYYRSYFVRVTE